MDRCGLAAAQLFDEADALLQPLAARLEVAHLVDHLDQALLLAALRFDVALDLGGVLAQRPVAPEDERGGEQEDQAAAEGDLLRRLEAERRPLGLAPFRRKKVDADHRSPPLRSARPTATAHTGA